MDITRRGVCGGGGVANANLKHCGLSVTGTRTDTPGHEREVGRREGRSSGCVGVPRGEWVYETWTPELSTAACCRIVDDDTDAELRASGCWVCTNMIRYYAFY